MQALNKLLRFLVPESNIMLGRWKLKHNSKNCENYILNYYGEPGYQNNLKTIWIEKNKDSKK